MDNVKEELNSKYELLLKKVKKNTGIDTITLSISLDGIIVDDYSKSECLLIASNYYNSLHISHGDNGIVGIVEQDLIDFNTISEIPLNTETLYLEGEPLDVQKDAKWIISLPTFTYNEDN